MISASSAIWPTGSVLYLGRIVEIGPAERVFHGPQHPYTAALLSAVPDIAGSQGRRIRLQGEIPSALKPPAGCVFQSRCPRKIGRICETEEPPLSEAEARHAIRCHIPPDELMPPRNDVAAGEADDLRPYRLTLPATQRQAKATRGLAELGLEGAGEDGGRSSRRHRRPSWSAPRRTEDCAPPGA